MPEDNTSLHQLPFDQYSRQHWATMFVDCLRTQKQLKILDVGGYKGMTRAFQQQDIVTICDLFDVEEPNYVKGDGRELPFPDGTFDFVVTFDTYEHVPREGRTKFISELLRVSKRGVILAAPFDNREGSVFQAEVNLNAYYKQLYNKDHPWLKEHIDYRIPNTSEIEGILNKMSAKFTSLASNDLIMWVLMQTIYFSIELDNDLRGRVDNLNRYYNHNIYKLDLAPDALAYRHIYFISRDQQGITKIEEYIRRAEKSTSDGERVHFVAYVLSVFGQKYRDVELYKNYLESEISNLQANQQKLENKLHKATSRSAKKRARGYLSKAKSKIVRKKIN